MVSQLIEESVDLPGQPATLRDAADCDLPSSATFFPSPEKIGWEIAAVLAVSLSADLEPWVARYSQVGHRDEFLWKWCRRGVEVTTQSCVDPKLFDRVCDTKVLGVVLDVLLDDVADHERDLGFLEH